MTGQLGCGVDLAWKGRSEAAILRWACGTKPWRTRPAIVTWAWRTAAAVPRSGTRTPYSPLNAYSVLAHSFHSVMHVSSVSNTCWIAVSVPTTRRGFWSCFKGWNHRMVSPLGVNRCFTLSTVLQITPPHWMVNMSLLVFCFCIDKRLEMGFSVSLSVVPTIVAYLKEVESPYEVNDFIRIYLGDTIEAKEFAKQFLERRAKQKANHQRQQQQVCVQKDLCDAYRVVFYTLRVRSIIHNYSTSFHSCLRRSLDWTWTSPCR